MRARPGVTALAGQVLRPNGEPLAKGGDPNDLVEQCHNSCEPHGRRTSLRMLSHESSGPRLTIHYTIFLYLSAGLWLGGWGVLLQLFVLSDTPFITHRLGTLLDTLLVAGGSVVCGLLGPVATAYYSLKLEISETEIVVRKYLGLWRRRYSFRDVTEAAYLPKRGERDWSRFGLRFRDGSQVTVESHASAFEALVAGARDWFPYRSRNSQ